MQIILRITRQGNATSEKLTRQLIGGSGVSYQAQILSHKVNDEGLRSILNLPGMLMYGSDKAAVRNAAIEHLVKFGFEIRDIEVQYK